MEKGMTFTGEAETTGDMAAKAVCATVNTIIESNLPGASLEVEGPNGETVCIEIKRSRKFKISNPSEMEGMTEDDLN
jgi:hypothetical protein